MDGQSYLKIKQASFFSYSIDVIAIATSNYGDIATSWLLFIYFYRSISMCHSWSFLCWKPQHDTISDLLCHIKFFYKKNWWVIYPLGIGVYDN